jgi:hypothetical protein
MEFTVSKKPLLANSLNGSSIQLTDTQLDTGQRVGATVTTLGLLSGIPMALTTIKGKGVLDVVYVNGSLPKIPRPAGWLMLTTMVIGSIWAGRGAITGKLATDFKVS